jgi:UDP-N-acetylglucosamine--N-acetylmuramyl-(pentapeptide) pyrophosphoryl-undecaprenol N-acetylglucosamine transferase
MTIEHQGERRVLAVATQGGHLVELHELLPRILAARVGADWVTFDTPQSRSLLAGQRVTFIRPVHPRQGSAVLANLVPARRLLAPGRYSTVVASGNAALSFLPLARALSIGAHFVESVTRTDAPSVTGRAVAAVPGIRRYTQHECWAGRSWHYRGSVFENFACREGIRSPRVMRVVVTVGMNPYPFRRLLDRLVEILPPSADVLWQTGATPTGGLPVDAHAMFPAHELDRAMAQADVVVAHAGVGSAIAALSAGRIPVLVARRQAWGEQVDDHQLLLAQDLAKRRLAISAAVEELSVATLEQASMMRAYRLAEPPHFELA